MEKTGWWHLALIAFLCTAIYANSFQNDFVFDDKVLITTNFEIRSFSNIPSFFESPSHANLYRPVRSSLYTIVYGIWGLNTFGYHLNSLIFHILNSFMVYLLAKALLKKRNLALIAALIFALHPVHTDRITNMTAGFDQFGIFLYFLSFYLYILYSKNSKLKYLIGSVVLFAVGIFSSEELVTLPVILFLYDFCFNKKKIKIKNYLYYVLIGIFFFMVRFTVLGRFGRMEEYYTGSLYSNIATTIPILLKYLKLLIIPYTLTLEYTPQIHHTIFDLAVLLSLFAVLALIYISTKSKMTLFLAGFFFITLSPFLNLIPLFTLMAERYLYIPSFAFCILAAIGFEKVFNLKIKNIKTITLTVFILILVIFSGIVIKRNTEWRDSLTLWTRTVETSPKSSRAHDNLGSAYQVERMYEKAFEQYEIAIKLHPRNYFAFGNRGSAYAEVGMYDKAITDLQTSILINPYYYKSYTNIGLAYYKSGDYEKAITSLKQAIELHPELSKAHNDLGVVYAEIGEHELAIQEIQKAIKIYPDYKDAHHNLGVVYTKTNQTELAEKEFELAG